MEIKNGSEDVKIHVVYRSPNSRRENDEELCNWVKGMSGSNVFVGDFNFPDIDWGNGTSGSRGCGFYEATEEVFLEQLVTTPTHNSGNILDLILCNREELVKEVRAEGRIGRSDHDLIGFKLCINAKKTKNQHAMLNFGKANFTEMRKEMANIDWRRNLEGKSTNEMWLYIRGQYD